MLGQSYNAEGERGSQVSERLVIRHVWMFWLCCCIMVMGGCHKAEGMNSSEITEADQALLDEIKAAAIKLEIKPIDARLDPVWHAIPGYNGLEVDIDKTFYYAKQLKGRNIPFIFKEVEPQVGLDDLGAHPIYKGSPHKPIVSIMINVAWGNEYLSSILNTLESENVFATFFLDGSWLKNNVELAKQIKDAGHELSNHAYSHKDMGDLSDEAARQEIAKTEQLLKEQLDVDNRWFAPPSGHYDQATVNIAAEFNLKTVLWTIDTVDWKHPHPAWIVKKIANAVEPGSLILMHPTDSASQALPDMIKHIKSKGLMLGTVSDTLSSARVYEVEGELKLW